MDGSFGPTTLSVLTFSLVLFTFIQCLPVAGMPFDVFELSPEWFGGPSKSQTESPHRLNTTSLPITKTTDESNKLPYYGTYTYNIYRPKCRPVQDIRKQDYLERLKEEWLEKLKNQSLTAGSTDNQEKNIFTIYSGAPRHRKIHKGVVIYRHRPNNDTISTKSNDGYGRAGKTYDKDYRYEGVHVHVHRAKDTEGEKTLPTPPTEGESKSIASCFLWSRSIVFDAFVLTLLYSCRFQK